MILSAGNIEEFEFSTPIGVGLINSALNLSKLKPKKDEKIIFIGTAGSYNKNINIMSLYKSSSASNIEISYLEDKSYTPIDNIIVNNKEDDIANVSRETLMKSIVVNSSNYITKDDDARERFHNIELSLENMEFYSVAKWAIQNNLKFEGYFVITNYCHKNAHEEFLFNYQSAKSLLEEHLKEENLI